MTIDNLWICRCRYKVGQWRFITPHFISLNLKLCFCIPGLKFEQKDSTWTALQTTVFEWNIKIELLSLSKVQWSWLWELWKSWNKEIALWCFVCCCKFPLLDNVSKGCLQTRFGGNWKGICASWQGRELQCFKPCHQNYQSVCNLSRYSYDSMHCKKPV